MLPGSPCSYPCRRSLCTVPVSVQQHCTRCALLPLRARATPCPVLTAGFELPGDQTTLLAVCGAQTIALAAADAIGYYPEQTLSAQSSDVLMVSDVDRARPRTLTQEDATQLRELLPDIPLPIHRVRFSVSGDDESPRASASFEARQPHRRLLYTGSCHAANEAVSQRGLSMLCCSLALIRCWSVELMV